MNTLKRGVLLWDNSGACLQTPTCLVWKVFTPQTSQEADGCFPFCSSFYKGLTSGHFWEMLVLGVSLQAVSAKAGLRSREAEVVCSYSAFMDKEC